MVAVGGYSCRDEHNNHDDDNENDDDNNDDDNDGATHPSQPPHVSIHDATKRVRIRRRLRHPQVYSAHTYTTHTHK